MMSVGDIYQDFLVLFLQTSRRLWPSEHKYDFNEEQCLWDGEKNKTKKQPLSIPLDGEMSLFSACMRPPKHVRVVHFSDQVLQGAEVLGGGELDG